MSNDILYLNFNYASDQSKNIQIRVNKVAAEKYLYYVEVDIHSRTLTGTIEVAVETVPQIVLDLVSELNSMASNVKVRAFEERLIENVVFDFWEWGSYPHIFAFNFALLSFLSTVLADATGPQDSVIVGCLNAMATSLYEAG